MSQLGVLPLGQFDFIYIIVLIGWSEATLDGGLYQMCIRDSMQVEQTVQYSAAENQKYDAIQSEYPFI